MRWCRWFGHRWDYVVDPHSPWRDHLECTRCGKRYPKAARR